MTMRIEISIVPFGDEEQKRVIHTIDVHNLRDIEVDPVLGPKCEYEVVDKDRIELDIPTLIHYRKDGALVLAAEAINAVDWAEFGEIEGNE